jgi:hypothetical protein
MDQGNVLALSRSDCQPLVSFVEADLFCSQPTWVAGFASLFVGMVLRPECLHQW